MTDPRLTLLELLKSGWSLNYEPIFTTDWYDSEISTPQVTVHHVYTNARSVGFSENPAKADRRFKGRYAVDVWSIEAAKRYEMLTEIDRILKSKSTAPGGDLEYLEVGGWSDMDEGRFHPPLFHSRMNVEVLYYG